jgi:hypothetical protein
MATARLKGMRKMTKTKAELLAEIKASPSAFVAYGDLSIPVAKADALADIAGLDEEMIGEGTWIEC